MGRSTVRIRLMRADDFDAVVAIDRKVMGTPRLEYYRTKFERLFESGDYIPTSLVAEDAGGNVIGFVIGELYIGEYGIFQEEARLDTLGVDPAFRHKGVGRQLIDEFMDHLKTLDVQKVNTLVSLDDTGLMRFFNANGFTPSRTVNLERTL